MGGNPNAKAAATGGGVTTGAPAATVGPPVSIQKTVQVGIQPANPKSNNQDSTQVSKDHASPTPTPPLSGGWAWLAKLETGWL